MRWVTSLLVVSGALLSVASRSDACEPAVAFVGTTSVISSALVPVAPVGVVSPAVVVPTAVVTPVAFGHACFAPAAAFSSARVVIRSPFAVRSVERTVVRQRFGVLPRVQVSIW
jgi:hypothetical protein